MRELPVRVTIVAMGSSFVLNASQGGARRVEDNQRIFNIILKNSTTEAYEIPDTIKPLIVHSLISTQQAIELPNPALCTLELR
jgi:hypothetical protein